MTTTLVRITTEEWPEDQWISLPVPVLGDQPFVLVEGDPSEVEFLGDDKMIMKLAVTVGGGFTEKNLPRLLRGLAEVLEIQERQRKMAAPAPE